MNSLPQDILRVKREFASHANLLQKMTTAEFLRRNPLPKHLAHLESTVSRLPFHLLFQTIQNCALAGLDDAGIGAALVTAAEYMAATEHRCVTCLAWTSKPVAMARVEDGVFAILAFCPRCTKRVKNGQTTAAMRRNLRAYGGAE